MGNLRLSKIGYLHRVGDLKFKRLKVAAPKLIHPTASPLFQKAVFSYCDTVSQGGGQGEGEIPGGDCGKKQLSAGF
jgi:hypothetical protein